MESKNEALPVLELVFFVVDWGKLKAMSAILGQGRIKYHVVAKGRGTVSSGTLDMLGIGAPEKAVVCCLEQRHQVRSLLNTVGKRLNLRMPGTGIGFSIPLAAVNAPILKSYADTPEGDGKEASMEDGKSTQADCDLIMAILNQGYSDEFMAAAREAGAGGGTVISARGLARAGAVKFFGITVQDEKEIVLVLTTKAKMAPIMAAVSKGFGFTSKAEGVIFSMPVDNVTGIDLS